MATAGIFALRYANAFASVAASAGLDVSAAQHQMGEFAELFGGNAELREILENPSVPAEQKLAVVDSIAERMGLMREVRNFIAVMMDHGRLGELNEIIAAYDRVADTRQGIAEASVTSAFALNPDDRAVLETQVARLAGTKVRVTYVEDSALLGGAVVKIGSTIYDGSVRGQLEQLKQTLVSV
jgi:F-type H+-transporting ATPase subunit delta